MRQLSVFRDQCVPDTDAAVDAGFEGLQRLVADDEDRHRDAGGQNLYNPFGLNDIANVILTLRLYRTILILFMTCVYELCNLT